MDSDLQAVYLDLEETKTKIPVAEQELKGAQNELAEAERDQEIVAAQLDAAQGELASIKDEIAQGQADIEASENNLGEVARPVPWRYDALHDGSAGGRKLFGGFPQLLPDVKRFRAISPPV